MTELTVIHIAIADNLTAICGRELGLSDGHSGHFAPLMPDTRNCLLCLTVWENREQCSANVGGDYANGCDNWATEHGLCDWHNAMNTRDVCVDE